MTTNLVPFGKYKGQPVEVLAQDREYCEWLVGQEWFRSKFVGIHTLIVNHFGEPAETPEHNALQARFLDPAWCQRVAIRADFEKIASNYLGRIIDRTRRFHGYLRKQAADLDDRATWHAKSRDQFATTHQNWQLYEKQRSEVISKRQQLEAGLAGAAAFPNTIPATSWMFSASAQFEVDGVDVVIEPRLTSRDTFQYWPHSSGDFSCLSDEDLQARPVTIHGGQFCIECKPLLGDDYPAVLRQMKSNGAHVLVAGEVRSSVVSLAQVRAIFAPAGIRVLTVADIEAQDVAWEMTCE